MTFTSLTDRSIEQLARTLTSATESRRCARRWNQDPVLDGLTPADVLTTIRSGTFDERDRVFGALVRRGQAGDHHAVELALVSLRLPLWRLLLNHFHRNPEVLDELYVHATLVLARIDPTLPILYDRVIGRVRAAGSAARRRDRRREETEITDVVPERATGSDPVADAVGARVAIASFRAMAADGSVPTATWNALVAIRVHGSRPEHLGDRRTPDHIRSDTSRLARKLEKLAA